MGFIVGIDSSMTYERSVDDRVAKALRAEMQRQGLLVKDLIERTDIPSATVTRHVTGKTFPKIEDRRKYARALKLSEEEFEHRWQIRDAFSGPGLFVDKKFGPLIAELHARASAAGKTPDELLMEILSNTFNAAPPQQQKKRPGGAP